MDNIIVHIPINLKTWGGRKVIIGPRGKDLRKIEGSMRRDEKLINAIARGYRWQKQLATGKYKSVEEIQKAENINSGSYILRMIRLTLLSPKIIEDILNGNQPSGFSLNHTKKSFSPLWEEQNTDFSFNSN